MTLISDILLVAAALGATFYCMVLSRRLSRFNDLEKGVGGAVAVLSAQVDDMTRTLVKAQAAASDSTCSLEQLTKRAENAAKRLELLVASMHDLPEPGPIPDAKGPAVKPPQAKEPTAKDPETKEQQPVPAAQSDRKEAESEALFLRHRDRVVEAAE